MQNLNFIYWHAKWVDKLKCYMILGIALSGVFILLVCVCIVFLQLRNIRFNEIINGLRSQQQACYQKKSGGRPTLMKRKALIKKLTAVDRNYLFNHDLILSLEKIISINEQIENLEITRKTIVLSGSAKSVQEVKQIESILRSLRFIDEVVLEELIDKSTQHYSYTFFGKISDEI